MDGGEGSGRADVDATYDTPPSTATSSTETISTNDEDARRCEEWELFSNFDGRSRPSESRLESQRSTSAESSWESAQGSARTQTSDDAQESSEESNAGDDEDDCSNAELSAEIEETEDDTTAADHRKSEGLNISEDGHTDIMTPSDECALSFPPEEDLLEENSPTQRLVQESSRSTASSQPIHARSDPSVIATSSRIQVFVRVRPPGRGEVDTLAVKLGDAPNTLRVQSTHLGSVTECAVDRVFIDSATQEDVYNGVERGVQAALDGINATIFAYGQTGTGKTHTMFGDDAEAVARDADIGATSRSTIPSDWGVIPRALWELITRTKTMQEEARAKLSCSFLQIYNDRVFDLLTDRKRQKPLIIREQPTTDGGTNVVLQGLSSEPISSLADALQLVRRGRMNRSVRETELNAVSSRSHAIVQVHVSIEEQLPNGDKRIRSSRLNLVDLAGSEKWNTDLDMEDRHTVELKNINTSLSALGNCIAALTETGRRHIPYRDSTLTRLLQDSFGGNTLAFLIATISPSQKATEETIRTLQFADRARSVMQIVKVNESFSGNSELLAAKAQIKQLRDRLTHEQRRRHETRLKEYEAMQNDFATKLQAKEEEIVRLARDNEVFAKWRAEDVARIRALEARIKEVEDETKSASYGGRSDQLDARFSQPQQEIELTISNQNDRRQEDNQATADPRTTYERVSVDKRPSLARKPSMKGAVNKHKQPESSPLPTPTTNDKSEKPRVKSYRSLLEKYALPSQKGKRGEPQRDTRRPPENNTTAAPSMAVKSSGVALECHRAQDTITNSSPEKRAPIGRLTSDVSFTAHSSPMYASRQLEDAGASRNLDLPQTQSSALHKAESLPALTASHQQLQQQQQSWSSFAPPAQVRMELTRTNNQYSSSDCNAKQAWQLPPVVPEAPAMSRSEPIVAASTPPEICIKHSLKGCVLCAVKESSWTPAAPQNVSTTSIKGTTTNVMTSSLVLPEPAAQGVKAIDNGGPCERHQLPGCFICTTTSSSSVWRPAAAFATGSNAAPLVSSISTTSSFMVTSQDSKCSTHRLANCVICAGLNNYRAPVAAAPVLVDTPSPIKWSVPESSWRSTAISTTTPSPLSSFPSSSMVTAIRDRSLSTWEPTTTTTPDPTPYRTQLQVQVQAQYQPAHGFQYSTTYGDDEDLGLVTSPAHASANLSSSSSQSPAIRRNIKELSTDTTTRRQFNALVREASDAAKIVLRRRA